MANIFGFTDVWNAAGTVFDCIKCTVTNTASAAGSDLLDLSITGGAQIRFIKTGVLSLSDGTNTGTITPSGTTGLTLSSPTVITGGTISGLSSLSVNAGITTGANSGIASSSGYFSVVSQDILYLRSSSVQSTRVNDNTTASVYLASGGGSVCIGSSFANFGTVPNKLSVLGDIATYALFTDANNYERLRVIPGTAGSGTLTIAAETLGTGVDNINIALTPVGTGTVNISSAIKIGANQVVGARVIDARADDVANSGDATTDGLIDALRDAMITHGLIAAA